MGLMTGGTDLDFDRRYTLADLESFPEDGRRYELADGWLIVSPMATAGRDAVLKSAAYARLGIPSYWLVDVDVPSIRVLELRAGVYVDVA